MNPKRNTFAALYLIEENALWPNDLETLAIDGKRILFLQETLYKDCLFQCNQEGWWLTFFRDSPRELRIHIHFFEPNKPVDIPWQQYSKDLHNSLYREYKADPMTVATLMHFNDNDDPQNTAAIASQLIRKSESIKITDYELGQYSHLHVDGKGLSLLSSLPDQKSHFQRLLLLLALGHAYLIAIEQLYNRLADSVKTQHDVDKLATVYQEAAEFNARFYFPQPVKVQRTDLAHKWQTIEHALGIEHNNAELSSQVQNIHYIIDLQASRKAQEREQKRNWWLAIFGLCLTALSLLDLFI